jgi:cytoskeletal protein CcmA (bactofilin family)
MTTLGPRVVISGEVFCDDDLTIEGSVEGRVTVREGTLTIETSAHVEADVKATRVLVLGTVRGAITATERIDLGASSSVEGSLSADQIAIAEGAHVSGNIDMGRRTIAARVAEYRAGRVVEV